MKKNHFGFSSLLWAILLVACNHAWAQKDTTMWMALNEYRVHDESIFQKNYPVVKAFWLKENAGIETDRIAHTSESGRIYGLVFFRGPENFGAFMGKRVKTSEEFNTKQPVISKENNQNVSGPIVRSIWVRKDSLCMFEPGYKMENYDFRKLQFVTVAADKIREFEAAAYKRKEMDIAHGIQYNLAVFKCTDGYPTNTYMLVLPDKSIIDYYKNRAARDAKREQTKNDYAPLTKLFVDFGTISRIDHLNRVK